MKINRFEDLDTYKLAVALRREVFQVSSKGRVVRDFKFVGQIRDAARDAPRNISEGFSRFHAKEFCNFLWYAKASIDDTKNHVRDGFESGYFTLEETLGAIRSLIRYLESPEAAAAFERIRKARCPRSRPGKRPGNDESRP